MHQGIVLAIFIRTSSGEPMRSLQSVKALQGKGLEGDTYTKGKGSFNHKRGIGHRQVTLINGTFFENTGYEFADSRRNIVTSGVELMRCIGKEFTIGEVTFRGVKYCEPCDRVTNLSSGNRSFHEVFHDRGGLVAEVLCSGMIQVNDHVTPPPKKY